MSTRQPPDAGADTLACARCGVEASKSALASSGYACPRCALDLAHLDTAPNGTIRGVIGWLRPPGTVLKDRYRVVELLGRGGFAVTYLAEDLLLGGKRRALKEVPEILFDEAESEILSRVQHPALPDITDRFHLEGMIYLVLEFGGSQTLEGVRRAAGGRVEVERVERWVAELCDVLAYLHEQDPPIVHRDLKPENILLDESGRIMIIDFGIAKAGGEDAVTRTIARSVSHGFGPPEQALGTGTDQRSDVYSLAATLYALLAGAAPPAAHERVSGTEIPPPSAVVAGLPPGLDDVLLTAMNLNVLKRHASIREFQRAFFEALGAGAPGPAVSSAPRTVAIDRLELSPPRRTGGTARTTGGAGAELRIAPAQAPAAAAPRARGLVFAAAGAALLVALGAAWYWTRGADASATSPPPAAEQAGVAPASDAASAPGGPALDPVLPPPALPAEPPPPASSGSALAALEGARGPIEEPPAADPAPRARAARAPAPPAPSRKPAAGSGDWGSLKVKEIRKTQ
jgi:serine/threonine-protein kinase